MSWLDQAEIADRNVEPPLDLTIGVVRETYRAGLGYALEARGDIDAVAHQIAVALLDDVAEMNADAGLYALVVGHADVALGQTALHVDGAADGFDYTAEVSTIAPSPVRLTTRPLWIPIVGLMMSLRKLRSRASVPSSSAPVSRL